MSEQSDGFHLLADELNSSVVKKILAWRDHAELGRLLTKLLSHTSRKAFLDSYAEAHIANHLLEHGCDLRFEVPTPQGKRCDFEVRHEDQTFYLHVKRLDTGLPRLNTKQVRTVSNRLRVLERIPRPYIVQVRWSERLAASQIHSLVQQADEFIRRARVGDEMTATADGRQIGGVRVIAPWAGDHVSVTVGLRGGFVDHAPRFRRMMERAHQQFMPRAINVILIGSDHVDDAHDFENALIGSHIERWDAFPKRGARLAHGRAEDGFWSGSRFIDSQYAGWFDFSPGEKELRSRLWVREQFPGDDAMQRVLLRIFHFAKE